MADTIQGDAPTRCGLVAVVGAPNAGKSTLVNRLVGQKVAITSAKPQTTRTRIMGIATIGKTQLLLADTPGIFDPRRRLDRAMVSAVWEGAKGADAILWLVDASAPSPARLSEGAAQLARRSEPVVLVLNKVDIAAKEPMLALASRLHETARFEETFFVSATTGDGVEELGRHLADAMPPGPWHYPADQVSDVSERLFAAEVTREQLYAQLHAELPYVTMVRTEQYGERDDGSLEIRQQIVVERATQRAIILGKGGQQIKAIGASAREQLGAILGRKVHLFLHVKVRADWSEDRELYVEMGLGWVR